MRKKTICAMMTGFLAVQGIEVHAETQQTTGEAASAVESVELEAEIIENSDVTDADGKAGPEELLPDMLLSTVKPGRLLLSELSSLLPSESVSGSGSGSGAPE